MHYTHNTFQKKKTLLHQIFVLPKTDRLQFIIDWCYIDQAIHNRRENSRQISIKIIVIHYVTFMLRNTLQISDNPNNEWKRSKFYLNEDSPIGVSMGINSTSGSLTTYVASESNSHPPTRRFGEERPWEGRYPLRTWFFPWSNWNRRTFHTWTRRPSPDWCRTQNQSHSIVLL